MQITAATAAAPVAAGVGTVRIPERHVRRILGHARKKLAEINLLCRAGEGVGKSQRITGTREQQVFVGDLCHRPWRQRRGWGAGQVGAGATK